MRICRRFFFLLLVCPVFLACARFATAQEYPTRPVRIIVSSSPGATADLIARIVVPEMSSSIGQPLIVENKPGAGQTIGLEYVAKQMPPDGYAVALATAAAVTISPLISKDLRFDPFRDVPLVISMVQGRLILGSASQFPWKTFGEFITHARNNPGKLNYGASSPEVRITSAAIAQSLGLDMVHIPYNGAGPYFQAINSGEVQLGIVGVASAISMGERFRPLAASGSQRLPPFLDVPTFEELNLPRLPSSIYSLHVRSGSPKIVFDKLFAAGSRALKQSEVKASLAKIQLEPMNQTREAAEKGLVDVAEIYAVTAKKMGIQPQ